MTNPGFGFQRMSGQMILDVIEQGARDKEAADNLRRREREQRAQSFAQVCHSFGVSLRNLTPAQRAYADAHANALKTRGGNSRPGGFSIDPSARTGYRR